MQVSDFYVQRAARRLLDLRGDAAVAEARARVVDCRARDDMLAADTWLRIIATIEEMRRERVP